MFVKNIYNSCVPAVELTEEDIMLLVDINNELKGYLECMEKQKLRERLKCILKISSIGNAYIQAGQPWKLIESNESERYYLQCYLSCLLLCYLAEVAM